MDDLDAYLDTVIVGERRRGPTTIRIVDYDPAWPRRFEAERRRIHGALGDKAVSIEHVGSTSVPGLGAKPIVDVLVSVADVTDETSYAPALEAAGYVLRVREPDHRMFRTPERDVHVHILSAGDPEVRKMLDFRDRLRNDVDDRALYERTKRELSRHEWRTGDHYAQAKTDVIEAILARAASR